MTVLPQRLIYAPEGDDISGVDIPVVAGDVRLHTVTEVTCWSLSRAPWMKISVHGPVLRTNGEPAHYRRNAEVDLTQPLPEWLGEIVADAGRRLVCCDLHGRNCEPPSELCCQRCTEAGHPQHRDGSACSNPDLSPPYVQTLALPGEPVSPLELEEHAARRLAAEVRQVRDALDRSIVTGQSYTIGP